MQNAETVLGVLRDAVYQPQPRRRSLESRMPANRHVRFGGGPQGEGPATNGHLAMRPTQPFGHSSRSSAWSLHHPCQSVVVRQRFFAMSACSTAGVAWQWTGPIAMTKLVNYVRAAFRECPALAFELPCDVRELQQFVNCRRCAVRGLGTGLRVMVTVIHATLGGRVGVDRCWRRFRWQASRTRW